MRVDRAIHAAPLVLALALACVAARAEAQLAGRWSAHTAKPGTAITDPLLMRVYERLLDQSPTFRALADSVYVGQLPVLLSTTDQVTRVTGQAIDLEDSPALARVLGKEQEGDVRYFAAMIVVDIETLRRWHARVGDLTPDDLEQDVAVLVAHEFIHVASIATTRSRRSACRDPGRVELLAEQLGHPSSSCVIEWENRIRTELGLPLRERYLDPALRIGHRLDIDAMLDEMRIAREPRPQITRIAAALPRTAHVLH